jgi:hypothetical protein
MLDAAERGRQVAHIFGIHPDHSGLQTLGEAEGTSDVGSPQIGRQSVPGVVRYRQGIGLILEADRAEYGAEDFLLGNPSRCALR